MATLYECIVRGSNQGRDHVNVFHVLDDNDNVVLADLADVFRIDYCVPMAPIMSSQMIWTKIEIKSLSAGNPGVFTLAINVPGTVAGDPMPTGVHVHVKLVSADQSEKSGAKMVGGWGEASFTGGNPTVGTLDALQNIYDLLLLALDAVVDTEMAIFRPTFSFPGIPAFSLVQSILVRGDSVSNRRSLAFER